MKEQEKGQRNCRINQATEADRSLKPLIDWWADFFSVSLSLSVHLGVRCFLLDVIHWSRNPLSWEL